MGSRIVTLLILCSAVDDGERTASHLDRFTPGRETPYPLNMRLNVLQSRFWPFCRREIPPEGCKYVNIKVMVCYTVQDIWWKLALAQSVMLVKLFILT
jgi:hypothetical protein